jgi:hypothetical protein
VAPEAGDLRGQGGLQCRQATLPDTLRREMPFVRQPAQARHLGGRLGQHRQQLAETPQMPHDCDDRRFQANAVWGGSRPFPPARRGRCGRPAYQGEQSEQE